MSDLTNQAPYYDDYDPSKRYTQIVAVPGRIEQAREFTQVQTMIYDFLKRLSDTLLRDGNIVAGMGFSFNNNGTGKNITVEDGRVYMNGRIHQFTSQTLTMARTGHEVIGVKLQEVMVTESTDSSLRDPALNMGNYGQPGAYRVQTVPILTLNDPDAAAMYEFQDGDLFVQVSKPQMDPLTDILAKRTFDESGNYQVNGLQLMTAPYDANNIQLTVEVGTAYVKGYQITKPVPVKQLLPISKATASLVAEPKTYITGTTDYPLNNYPIADITQVVADVQKTYNMTRGSQLNGLDYLPDQSVISIISVVAGATTYVQGTDYQLTNNAVDWSLLGAEPSVGSTYTVTYQYNAVLVQGTDYQKKSITDQWGSTTDYCEFMAGGKTPVPNSQFQINYDYYLARKDAISLDSTGNIVVTSGQPMLDRLVTPPLVNDPDQLLLGYVYFPPNSGNAQASSKTTSRLDMSELQAIASRLDNVEYNQAMTALDQEAMSGESPADLIGVFSDGFRTTQKGDLTNPLFTAMYSLEDGMILIPPKSTTVLSPTIDTGNSNATIWGTLITAPVTESIKIQQPYATQTMAINPYLVFNAGGKLSISPSVDNWIETDTIQIENTQFKAANFYRWWGHSDPWYYQQDVPYNNLQVFSGAPQGTTVGDWRPVFQPGVWPSVTAMTTNQSSNVIDTAITYMRQKTVTITATNLLPSADNLALTFDGVSCTLTPATGYQSGSTTGTVRADSSGKVVATFTIPPNIVTGTREVILSNNNNTCSTTYTSIGTKETTVDTITKTFITLTAVDPLAQTFQFNVDTVLTSVGIYLSAKDSGNNLVVQIRNVVNGYPGTTVYGEVVVSPSNCHPSADATAETKVTFVDPIMCSANTQYCIVVETNSATDSMYICDLGQKDITTGTLVSKQPYLAGLLFSSKNGIAWTANQTMNMKFNIYTGTFNPTGTIQFDPITSISADKLLLLAEFLTPANTGCIWSMNINDGGYQPVTSFQDFDTNLIVNKVQLQATFKSDTNMSPLISQESFTLVGFLQDTSAVYVSKNTNNIDPYNYVKMQFEADIPQGCTITPQFSYDNGTTWQSPPQTHSTAVEPLWSSYVYELTLPAGTNATNFRARLNINCNDSILRPKARKLMAIMK